MKLILATHNLHKVREIREMMKLLPHVDVFSLLNFPDYRLPEETGETFLSNAALKAQHAAKQLHQWVLADDSGLVVPGMGGKPGVLSKRYAGDGATDADNRKKLLQEMESLVGFERAAYYECCLALANPEGLQKAVTATCEGTIIQTERGRQGFGYDSLFLKNDYDKTFAEISEQVKNKISHRRKAFDKLVTFLETLPQ